MKKALLILCMVSFFLAGTAFSDQVEIGQVKKCKGKVFIIHGGKTDSARVGHLIKHSAGFMLEPKSLVAGSTSPIPMKSTKRQKIDKMPNPESILSVMSADISSSKHA